MVFIFFVLVSFFNSKRISINIKDLQIFEASFFITDSSKIGYNFLKASNFIVSDRKNIQLWAVLKAIQNRDTIVIERQISQID